MITSILLLPIKEKPILTLITNIITQKMWEYDGIANWIEIITTMILTLLSYSIKKHPDIKPTVYIGKPCMVNPNSIDTVREVLHHVE